MKVILEELVNFSRKIAHRYTRFRSATAVSSSPRFCLSKKVCITSAESEMVTNTLEHGTISNSLVGKSLGGVAGDA